MKHYHRLLGIYLGSGAIFLATPLLGQKPHTAASAVETSEKPAPKTPAASAACNPVMDVCDVIKQYAALTHFRVIYDNFVQGKISLDVSGQAPEKAIDSIERTL